MDLKKEEEDNEKHDEENRPSGEKRPAQPVSLKKSESQKENFKRKTSKASLHNSMKTKVRGKKYATQLIKNNIKDTDFLYMVNFRAGKGQNDQFTVAFRSKLFQKFNTFFSILHSHNFQTKAILSP